MEQDGGWKSTRKGIDKGLLKNIIRHTDAHNKIQEQNEMWKHWELKKQSQKQDQSQKHDDRTRGYMRSDTELSPAAKKESLKWNRLLLEYEETRSDRWGHSGYKELYPEEFEHGIHSKSNQNNTDKVESKSTKSSGNKQKEKKEKLKKSRKVKSDSIDGKTDRSKRNAQSKNFNKDPKTRERHGKMETYKEASRVKQKEKTPDKYIGNAALKSRDRKRKVELDSGLKNGRRDRKRKSESENTDDDASVGRSDTKRNSKSSRKHDQRVENIHTPKKKKKIKH